MSELEPRDEVSAEIVVGCLILITVLLLAATIVYLIATRAI